MADLRRITFDIGGEPATLDGEAISEYRHVDEIFVDLPKGTTPEQAYPIIAGKSFSAESSTADSYGCTLVDDGDPARYRLDFFLTDFEAFHQQQEAALAEARDPDYPLNLE